MLRRAMIVIRCVLGCLVLLPATPARAEETIVPASVVCAGDASFAEKLAAREIRRYLYLRTGRLLPIEDRAEAVKGATILVGSKASPIVRDTGTKVDDLGPEQYLLTALSRKDRSFVLVAGGDPIGTLYGAYRLAERLGVRFYLHGDVIPDHPIPLGFATFQELGKPLFDRRGIQPFHDFPEGPDWWNLDAYKACIGQLPKLRMNFFGLHTYPEGGVGPEPVTWIGPSDQIGEGGRVKASYPARHFTAASGTWGYPAMKTGAYTHGAAALFDRDDYGADYMKGMTPWPGSADDQNELFFRMGGLLHEAFSHAHQLGVKTCLGTETPLVIPSPVKARLKQAGKNPDDPAVVQELYEGIFRRIARTHPLDYYWFWTPEGWTWSAVSQPQIDATLADFRAAIAAYRNVRPSFTLATCGWVLGPPQQPALFDGFLPKEMPMSCINRQVGNEPVEPGFARVEGRPRWAIPWLEDDPGLTSVQLWAGRMRKDAVDARSYGCTGLVGIHWRTRILGPNVAALAAAAWDQSWNSGGQASAPSKPSQRLPVGQPGRFLPVDDFYADWALAHFGPEVAPQAAAIFARIDGHLPRPTDWTSGPGGIKPDPRPWDSVRNEYAFIDDFEALRSQVRGAGNLERFDYWLDSFLYLKSAAHAACHWHHFNEAMARVKAAKTPADRKALALELALPVRKDVLAAVAELHRHLLATVSTPGELGTVANWQQHNMPDLVFKPGLELAAALGTELPADAEPTKVFQGAPRIFVPVVRTGLTAGDPLALTVHVLGARPMRVVVSWRKLGEREAAYAEVPLSHVSRGVWTVTLPAEATKCDLEYFVQAVTEKGQMLRFPATAPEMNQTVVVVEAKDPRP